mmetsp:Transcript_16382/g.31027  ORF Transcript_16382/g.31027 Transcript_16382/m.31027 type:complete len:931 (-) Transcript_16382:112-2904(-)|eukprot:CAMPEP_0176504018 /NCGR_PEP_ID=MMETSP0200_2-20121128/15695_1 /TAXON_ID=947934 /ORGANISM="Chaetoceros sp., Strain GSL56" /LENGTH=930 /DNA_ID=CAMNT_0017903393 /DNA_START=224 /DNA_END=3016 /DNA_ORIENTATION=-
MTKFTFVSTPTKDSNSSLAHTNNDKHSKDETPQSQERGRPFISRIFRKSSSNLLLEQEQEQQPKPQERGHYQQQQQQQPDVNNGGIMASYYCPPTPTTTTNTTNVTTAYAISSVFPPRIATPSQHNMNPKQKSQAIKRYRGFSTSISSLFLDETIVCPSAAWCGILSSCRTEHLLHVRNKKRKVLVNQEEVEKEFHGPSRILAICLLSTLVAIVITYVIWGFGSTSSFQTSNYYVNDNNYYNGYDNRGLAYVIEKEHPRHDLYNHRIPNVMRFKDYRDRFWLPLETMAKDILFQGQQQLDHKDDSEQLQQQRYLLGGRTNFWNDQQVASNIRSILWVAFFLVLGIFGRRRRMKTRYAVLKARMEDDKAYYGVSSSSGGSIRNIRRMRFFKSGSKMERESKYDGACSHTLCGCYPVDTVEESADEEPDCVNLSFRKLFSLCCGICCRLWFQCLSICALAQEAREARLLLPPKDQRVDYLTHQPFEEYYKDVYLLRQHWKSSHDKKYSWKSHFAALSKLSRYILATFIFATLIIIVTERLNPLAVFSWADACVLMMTFIQSFIVLGIFHGFFHKSDLSLDAVIKFFAAGFVIATPMAFLIEVIVVNILMSVYYVFALIIMLIDSERISVWFYNNYRYLLVVGDIIQAFLVAAASEEFCKYYTFRSVEHPDLIFLTGLDRSKQDIQSKVGGEEAYPFSSNNASAMESRVGTFESTFSSKSGGYGHKNHRGVSPSTKRRFSFGAKKGDEEEMEDIRTVRQRAAALTIAMISTAVGLACAENFIYVFFLSGRNTQEEITMLLFRSIFPVHALCAGIQSIGVIKKFLEVGQEGSSLGVGKIVLPSILLHGAFDSVLMIINSYIDLVAESDDDQLTQPNTVILNVVAACCVTSVMLIGAVWYWRQNRVQKSRLKVLEMQVLEKMGKLPPTPTNASIV